MATKHRCHLTNGNIDLDKSLIFLLSKNNQQKIERSQDTNDYAGKKG